MAEARHRSVAELALTVTTTTATPSLASGNCAGAPALAQASAIIAAMRSAPFVMAAALACAVACDGTTDTDGARGACASGGALAGCDDGAVTHEDACWRLVECGSYPVDAEDENGLDWGRCMNDLEGMIDDRAALVTACIATSTCDELRAPGSPHPFARPACFLFGGR